MKGLNDPVLTQNSKAYHKTLDALHREYGDVVSLDQVREWFHEQGFDEESVEPEFDDMPRTKFVKEGHPLEYKIKEASNIPYGPKFAILTADGERYHADMPLTLFPARRSA